MKELVINMRELTDVELDEVCGGRRITLIQIAHNKAVVVKSRDITIEQTINQAESV
jgi:hypothetical protein